MTFKEFARDHGISPQWLCQLFNGANISDALANKLAETTGEPVRTFLVPSEKRRLAVTKYCQSKKVPR